MKKPFRGSFKVELLLSYISSRNFSNYFFDKVLSIC